jgi:Big-like domain-containing protein
VSAVLPLLKGHHALVAASSDRPECIVGARKECPLVVGVAVGESFVASAIPAFLRETRDVVVIESGEVVAVGTDGATVWNERGDMERREPTPVDLDEEAAERGGFETFMLKEIHEQPIALHDTIGERLGADGSVDVRELGLDNAALARVEHVHIVACGTSYHAGHSWWPLTTAGAPCRVGADGLAIRSTLVTIRVSGHRHGGQGSNGRSDSAGRRAVRLALRAMKGPRLAVSGSRRARRRADFELRGSQTASVGGISHRPTAPVAQRGAIPPAPAPRQARAGGSARSRRRRRPPGRASWLGVIAALALLAGAPGPGAAHARGRADHRPPGRAVAAGGSSGGLTLIVVRRGPRVGRPYLVLVTLLSDGRVNVDLDRIDTRGRALQVASLANISLRAGQRAHRSLATRLPVGRYQIDASAVTSDRARARARISFAVRGDGTITAATGRIVPRALASVDVHETFVGDGGTTYTFTIDNVTAGAGLRAVEILRPSAAFRITGCPRAPPGWTGEATSSACRFRSGRDAASYIPPAGSATFVVRASTAPGASDATGAWGVAVSRSRFFSAGDPVPADSEPGGLSIRAYVWEVTDAVIAGSPPSAGAPCPAGARQAPVGSTQTIAVCATNHANVSLAPVAGASSLTGTFIASAGSFASAAIAPGATEVVVAAYPGTTMTASAGAGKTLVAAIRSTRDGRSRALTLRTYTALGQAGSVPTPTRGPRRPSKRNNAPVERSSPPAPTARSLPVQTAAPLAPILGGSDPHGDPLPTPDAAPLHSPASGAPPSPGSTSDDGGSPAPAAAAQIQPAVASGRPTVDRKTVTTAQGTTVQLALSGTDPEGSPLTFAVDTRPSHGTLTGSAAPDVTYTPDAGYAGPDSFSYVASDGSFTSSPATVSITVAAGSPAPPPAFFSPQSVWNAPLPAVLPLAADSDVLVQELLRQVHGYGTWLNTTVYSAPVITVPATQPPVRVTLDAWRPDLQLAFDAVPLPDDAKPAQGLDAHLVVWQPSTDTMWEFWQLVRRSDGWHAAHGGRILGVSTDSGIFPTYPGWGATATGLALVGGMVTLAELRAGRIDHALALAIPDTRANWWSWPAQRTDGNLDSSNAIPEGTRFRLDPTLNLDQLNLSPVTRMLADAAQRYGIVVRDRAGAVVLYGEDPTATGWDPYPQLIRSPWANTVTAPFPWEHLQVVRGLLRTW